MSDVAGSGQSPNRKLGRGLGALLSIPVRVPGKPGSGSDQSGTGVVNLKQEPAMGITSLGPSSIAPPPEGSSPSTMVEEPASRSGKPSNLAQLGVDPNDRDVPRGTDTDVNPVLGMVSVDLVDPNPSQPRREFTASGLESLGESIKIAGLMQPIVVRRSPTGRSERFELIAGERRLRAAKLIGLKEVPALVHRVDDQVQAEWALIENIQREDLNPIERCEALQHLVDRFGLTHQELGIKVGLDRVTVTNLLRLGDLDAFTKEAVRTGRLSQGHAKALLGVTKPEIRKTLASAAISGDWSVRELERRIKGTGSELGAGESGGVIATHPVPSPVSPHVIDLERKLSEHLGSKVSIQLGRKKGTGKVVIDFYTLDQFDGLMEKLGFRTE